MKRRICFVLIALFVLSFLLLSGCKDDETVYGNGSVPEVVSDTSEPIVSDDTSTVSSEPAKSNTWSVTSDSNSQINSATESKNDSGETVVSNNESVQSEDNSVGSKEDGSKITRPNELPIDMFN